MPVGAFLHFEFWVFGVPRLRVGARKFLKEFGGMRFRCHRMGDAREWSKGYGDVRILVWPQRLAGV